MKLLFLIILIICFGGLYAQTSGDENVAIYFDGGDKGTGILSSVTIKEPIPITVGNVYLFKEWVKGAELFSTTNKKYKIIGLNYNIQKGKFQIKISKDSVFTLDSNYIDHIIINKRIFRKLDSDANSKEFYEIVFSGKDFSIVKKNNLRLIQGKLNLLDGSIEPNKYYTYQEYYLNRNGRLVKFNLKRKAVLSLFEEKATPLSNYAKKNRLSYKKEKDVIKMFKYFNTL